MQPTKQSKILAVLLMTAGMLLPTLAQAHCDTMDGPVEAAAKTALAHNNVTSVLKWVAATNETEVRAAFAKTLNVRALGPAARDLADQYFFETIVRLHRASEGEPFMGLKPAGTVEPTIAQADKALETDSVDQVVRSVTDDAAAGIRQRFAAAREKQIHADESVAAGCEFVKAYVEYVHYVEELHQRPATPVGNKDTAPEHGTQQTHSHSQETEK